jgi:hypothetical protein
VNPETGTTLYFAAKELASRFFELPMDFDEASELDLAAEETKQLLSRVRALQNRIKSRNARRAEAQARKR